MSTAQFAASPQTIGQMAKSGDYGIPREVFSAVNKLLARKINSYVAIFNSNDLVDALTAEGLKFPGRNIPDAWLDFTSFYRSNGWHVDFSDGYRLPSIWSFRVKMGMR